MDHATTREPGTGMSRAPRRLGGRAAALLLVILGLAGCSLDGLLNGDQLPTDVSDPAITQTPSGARAAYFGTLAQFSTGFGSSEGFVPRAGVLSDELMLVLYGGLGNDARVGLDRRDMPEGAPPATDVYPILQKARGQAGQAIGLLTHYLPDQPALAGHLYAIQGYIEIFLAELYCSGVPLSTVDFGGDFTYRPGSTTEQVFTHAVALFDTALVLAADSASFLNLARVGRARALLNLGEYATAAAGVAGVSDDYRYGVGFVNDSLHQPNGAYAHGRNFAALGENGLGAHTNWLFTVSDREGTNGLDYRSNGDPRTAVTAKTYAGTTLYHPDKYDTLGDGPIILASGVEARLIEAEAALQAGDVTTWLDILNRIRTGGMGYAVPADTIADTLGVTGCDQDHICGTGPGGSTPEYGQPAGGFPVPAGYSYLSSFIIDPVSDGIIQWCYNYSWYTPCYIDGRTTVDLYVRPPQLGWTPGIGGVGGLAPLNDPGTPDGRVDLLFRERAFWLFLTGHRQGDLRRLIREYGRSEGNVYPIGPYLASAFSYGADVTVPIPPTEFVNPLYTGCASRGA